jgi:hypothetical protein
MAWVFNPFTGTFDFTAVSPAGVLPPSGGGTGTSTVFTQGSVVFAGASGVYSQDNANFFWDDTNNFLGIGTALPAARLHVAGGNIQLDNDQAIQWGGGNNFILGSNASNYIRFYQNGVEAMRISGTGNNVLIGTTASSGKLTLTQAAAGATCAQMTGVSGAKIIVDYIGNGSHFYDADVHTWRKANSTTTQAIINTDGNFFLGASARSWLTSVRAIDISTYAGIAQGLSGACIVGFNTFLNTSGQYAYKVSSVAATLYACGQGGAGVHSWSVAGTGTANNAITFTRAMTLDANSNLLLGTTTSPTTATNSLAIANGTAPSAVAATTWALYSSNLSANNTIPSVWTEGTGITGAGITSTTVTTKIAIRVNGTVYYLLATTNGT